MFIAEQQMVAAAVGLAVRGYVPFASTFAAFFTRAYDFVRMPAISQAELRLVGTHAGVEIGADGPSQMALEDLAIMRAVHGSTVLYPSDATAAAALVAGHGRPPRHRLSAGHPRRLPGPLRSAETFHIGGSKVLRSGPGDAVTLIGAGVTLHACLAAADRWPARASAPGSSTSTRSSRSTPRPWRRRRPPAAAWWSPRTTTPPGGWAPPWSKPCSGRGARPALHPPRRPRPARLGDRQELLAAAGISAPHIVAAARALVGG